ncbi:MAG: HlyD family efflux transporter periplasmic adaptor subunit [Prolixibacteraceae bacterium]|nr:HlyD family efflux transporter periplasmic adaptor subunit [Prolixibacteraceae bacterium]
MDENKSIEIHSEEVQDIMGRIPGSLLRWGLTILFLIFMMLIVGSYFFKFNEIVSAPMLITTSNPPAPLTTKTSGRINKWYVSDGQKVCKGEYIALINNPAQVADVLKLEQIADSITNANLSEVVFLTFLSDDLVLGDMQTIYDAFLKNWRGYRDYLNNHFLLRKIELHNDEMLKYEQNYNLSLQQKELIESEFELAKKKYARYEDLIIKGGISESELDNAKSSLIQSERAYTSFLASLKTLEIGLIGQKRALLEMQEQHRNNIIQFETEIVENIRTIKNSITSWRSNYLLISPINGVVTLTKFWSENHVVSAGERLATIVPEGNQTIICRALVSSSGVGKVEPGQKVNIKLSGYPYMQYGMLQGAIRTVSLVPESDGYIVEISLQKGMVSNYKERLKLIQEMEGTAEIITQRRRLIFRFINPLKAIVSESK